VNKKNKNRMNQIERLKPEEIDFVGFHHPCYDGRGSEWVAKSYFQKHHPEKKVTYIPLNIGTPLPPEVKDKNVVLCDISYRKQTIDELLKCVKGLLIIDHHKSAEKDLALLDNKYKIFDMNHSGAMLTWFYFYGRRSDPPLFLKYIEDRDIWKKELPFTDEFTSWFYTKPLTFEEFEKHTDNEKFYDNIITTGASFVELNQYYIDESVRYSVVKFQKMRDGNNYFIVYVNSSILKSDIGNKIFNTFKYADFSVVYSISDYTDSTSFSLRSTEKHVDVSLVASQMNGGGHRNASGVKVDYVTNYLPGVVLNTSNLYKELEQIYFSTLSVRGKEYNVVYMSSNTHNYKLCSYLLQTKYMEKDIPIQECCSIRQIRDDTNEMIHCQMAGVWTYNVNKDETFFAVCVDKKNYLSDKHVFDGYFGRNIDSGLVFKGFHKIIPTDLSLIVDEYVENDTFV